VLRRPARQGSPPGAPAPVIIFVTGGMWIIGYKAWGALLASRLRAAGCVVAALDYRNFPQGTVSDMAADVAAGVAWTLRHAKGWGGDPARCAAACANALREGQMRRKGRK
jgi:prenylcysteine alpha-carboxyl methylesterase